MKVFYSIIIFLYLMLHVTKASAQNKDYVISMTGIGGLKIGMSQAEIEKMLNQKFVLQNALDTAISWQDSATARYNNSSVMLFFQRHYTAENIYSMYLTGVKTGSSLFKTEAGIGMGADKMKIISAYKADFIFMRPEFEDEALTKISKTGYVIGVSNNNGDRQIIFYLQHNKVIAIEVKTLFNDEE